MYESINQCIHCTMNQRVGVVESYNKKYTQHVGVTQGWNQQG